MNWSDIDLRPDARKLRQFAAIWLLFFGVLAFLRHSHAFALAAALGLIGLALPAAMRPVFIAATLVTFPIGWFVSRLVLAALFYLVFTPMAILFRIAGRDALRLRRRNETSYWLPKRIAEDERQYFRQF